LLKNASCMDLRNVFQLLAPSVLIDLLEEIALDNGVARFPSLVVSKEQPTVSGMDCQNANQSKLNLASSFQQDQDVNAPNAAEESFSELQKAVIWFADGEEKRFVLVFRQSADVIGFTSRISASRSNVVSLSSREEIVSPRFVTLADSLESNNVLQSSLTNVTHPSLVLDVLVKSAANMKRRVTSSQCSNASIRKKNANLSHAHVH